MHRGRQRTALGLGSALIVGVAAACVDLFHGTDFETLCDRDGAACESDASAVDVLEAAADAPRPLIDFCAWTAAEAKEHATRACAWIGACGGPLGESVFGPCMLRALAAYDCAYNPGLRPAGGAAALWSCLADVRSCAEVDACLFPSGLQECEAVPAGTSFTACVSRGAGPMRVECGRQARGRPTGVEVCGLTGETCTTFDDSRAECTGTQGSPCAAGTRCAGTAAVACAAGESIDRGLDCADVGSGACVEDDGGAACAPAKGARSCSADARVACDGGAATSCVGGQAVTLDCARIGVGCDVTTKPVSPLDPFAACAENVDAGRCVGPDVCDGDTLKSCAQGLTFSVGCASVGLTGGCATVVGKPVASCLPP